MALGFCQNIILILLNLMLIENGYTASITTPKLKLKLTTKIPNIPDIKKEIALDQPIQNDPPQQVYYRSEFDGIQPSQYRTPVLLVPVQAGSQQTNVLGQPQAAVSAPAQVTSNVEPSQQNLVVVPLRYAQTGQSNQPITSKSLNSFLPPLVSQPIRVPFPQVVPVPQLIPVRRTVPIPTSVIQPIYQPVIPQPVAIPQPVPFIEPVSVPTIVPIPQPVLKSFYVSPDFEQISNYYPVSSV